MERVEKAATLDNEVEAQLVDCILTEQNIPHVIRSYHDTAYDGLFQGPGAWGHVEAPLDFHERINQVIEEVRQQPPPTEDEQATGGDED